MPDRRHLPGTAACLRGGGVLGILFTTLIGCSAPPTTFSAAHRAAIVDSVQTTLTQWRDALNAKDFVRAGTYYSADSAFRWYDDGQLTYASAQALRDTMLAMAPALRGFDMTLIDPKITALAPGVAIATTEFTEKLTDTAGNLSGFAGAVSITVVHADSGWRFLVGHNSSLPPPVDRLKKPSRPQS